MKRLVLSLLVLLLFSSATGCTPKPQMTEADVEAKHEELAKQSESRTVQVVSGSYLGGKRVRMSKADITLGNRILLNMRGTLPEICTTAGKLTGISMLVDGEEHQKATSVDPNALALPDVAAHRVTFEGPLKDFFEHLGSLFGVGWEYEQATNTVLFSRMQVKTFTLLAAPGRMQYKNQITNQSKENNTSSGGGIMGQTVNASDISSQTAQSNQSEYSVDVWNEAVTAIRGMLSKGGTVTANPTSGMVTVRDSAPTLRQVASFVRDFNTKLARQIALDVRVWQLEVSDDRSIGFDLKALFEDGKLQLASGTTLDWSKSGGELGVTVTGGKLKDSDATLKALKTFGKTSLLTSGAGTTMNNMPFSIQNTDKDTYLASVSLNTTDYGQTSQITPGEITVGYAMTVIPHILDRRTLILQYNCSLTALNAMREYSNDYIKVEMPKVSTRAFSQRVTMKMGQTLVLAGFAQDKNSGSNTVGLFGAGHNGTYGKTLVIITISVESMPGYMTDEDIALILDSLPVSLDEAA